MRRLDPLLVSCVFSAVGLSLAGCASAPKPSPVVPATTPPAPAKNPFEGATLYVNPDYKATVEALAAKHPEAAGKLKKLAGFPTAIWMSKIEDLAKLPHYLDDAQAQQAAGGKPVVPVFVVYDMPGRDCAAAASAGELAANETGEARYQKEYIDVIAGALAAHPKVNTALIVEPDSLANLVTNLEKPNCATAAPIYKRAIAYAIAKLSLPNAYLYVDAAHAGWLGWPRNLVKSLALYKEVLAMAGGPDRIRGFATDVSNYDPSKDPSAPKRDPAAAPNDELGYVEDLAKGLPTVGITGKGFVIDTGRDGVANVRTSPGNWCNIKGAGLGERPQAAPAPNVDAYLWIKVPGESDGTADPKAARFDENCASDDASPGAPEAGLLFEPYLLDLVKNANPAL
ncbi:MAG TPA: glycoside hydrolase family 6 protein [Polyangia bacterium]|nr:glycoside hydrolase family 6 protein [Polyangia bacterium]